MCLLKVPDGDINISRVDAKLGVEDNDAVTAGRSADCDRSPTPMQSSESLVAAAEGPGGSKSPGVVRDVCDPVMKADRDRHVADMATLTVDDMVRHCCFYCAALCASVFWYNGSQLLVQERVWTVGDFCWVGSVLGVTLSALTLLVG